MVQMKRNTLLIQFLNFCFALTLKDTSTKNHYKNEAIVQIFNCKQGFELVCFLIYPSYKDINLIKEDFKCLQGDWDVVVIQGQSQGKKETMFQHFMKKLCIYIKKKHLSI